MIDKDFLMKNQIKDIEIFSDHEDENIQNLRGNILSINNNINSPN